MERVPIKFELLVLLFVVASSLAPASSKPLPQMSVGPNKKQVFLTGQLCQSHDDCKAANTAYSGHFCVNNNIAGSDMMGHCVGFDPRLDTELKKKKKPAGCGKCETDADCKGCPAAAAC